MLQDGLVLTRVAAKYRFTDLAHGAHPPTRDFEKWTGELFVYTPDEAIAKNRIPSYRVNVKQYDL